MRNFEEEYKNYINEEVPDLWSRIESSLPEKQVKVEYNSYSADVNNDSENNSSNQNTTAKKNAKVIRFFRVAMPAAAAVCLLLVGVSALGLSKKSESNTAASADRADADCESTMADESVASEACEDDYDAVYEADEWMMPDAAEESAASDEAGASNDATAMNDAETADVAKDDKSAGEETAAIREKEDNVVSYENALFKDVDDVDSEMSEKGYRLVYIFETDSDGIIYVYVPQELYEKIDEIIELERNESYELEVLKISSSDASEKAFELVKISEK